MKKRIMFLMLLTALLLTGCAMQTVEEMYALPKRSEEFNEMQSAIDMAMYGMTYASPQSGENQQTVQMADLDGDGTDEILVFAKGATEKPLQVLIFTQDENGHVRTMETIGNNGLAFERVNMWISMTSLAVNWWWVSVLAIRFSAVWLCTPLKTVTRN